MAVVSRVEPLGRDISVLFEDVLSPAARSRVFAETARTVLRDTDETNRRALGRVPPHRTFVDGSEGAALERVRPDGTIVREYDLVLDALLWIGEDLVRLSPVGSGRDPHPGLYRRTHTLFADGAAIEPTDRIPLAREFVWMSPLPYARKIEGTGSRPPQSRQAPEGVYEVVAARARRMFGRVVRIQFAFRTAVGGAIVGGRLGNASRERNPAIVVTVR